MGKNCLRHCWLDYAHWLPGCSCKKDHRGICSPIFRRCFKIALPSYFVHSLLYFWEQLLCLSSQSPCLLSTPLSGTYEDRIRKWEESTFPETTISEIGIACLHGRLRQWESILTSTWMSLGKKATGSHSTFLQVFLSRAWPASGRSCCLHPSSPCTVVLSWASSQNQTASGVIDCSQHARIGLLWGSLGGLTVMHLPVTVSENVSLGKCALIWDHLFLTWL